MNKIWAWLLVGMLLLCFVGCAQSDKSPDTDDQKTQDGRIGDVDCVYDIIPSNKNVDFYFGTKIADAVRYPVLVEKGTDETHLYYDANFVLSQKALEYMASYLREGEDGIAYSTIGIDYTVTLQQDELVNVLFEGKAGNDSDHLFDIAMSLCVSIETGIDFSPLRLIKIDAPFLTDFRLQAKDGRDEDRFTADQWNQILSLIEGYTDEELKTMIESSGVALTKDGVIILFPTTEALGNYAKIRVPCEWTYDVNMHKDDVEIKFSEKDFSNVNWDDPNKSNGKGVYTSAVAPNAATAAHIATAIYRHTILCDEDNPQCETVSADGDRWTVAFKNARISFNKNRLEDLTVTDANGKAYTESIIPDMDAAVEITTAIYSHSSVNGKDDDVPQIIFRDKENRIWDVTFYEPRSEYIMGDCMSVAIQEDGKVLCIYYGA